MRGPTSSNKPRHQVDLDREGAELAQQREQLRHRLVREGDHHSLDIEALDDVRQPLRTAENRQMLGEVGTPRLGIAVDEADDVDPVLRDA